MLEFINDIILSAEKEEDSVNLAQSVNIYLSH